MSILSFKKRHNPGFAASSNDQSAFCRVILLALESAHSKKSSNFTLEDQQMFECNRLFSPKSTINALELNETY